MQKLKFFLTILVFINIILLNQSSISNIGSNIESKVLTSSSEGLEVFYPSIDSPGDCAVVKFGDIEILIDGGSVKDDDLKSLLLEVCTDRVLEYIIVTHGDEDHIKVFPSLFNTFLVGINNPLAESENTIVVERIIDFHNEYNGEEEIAQLYTTMIFLSYTIGKDILINTGVTYNPVAELFEGKDPGENVVIPLKTDDDEATLNLLYNKYYFEIPQGNSSEKKNTMSICLMIQYGDSKFMSNGDVGNYYNFGEAEDQLVHNDKMNLLKDITLYKASHHGSKTSNGSLLLDHITPQYVMITCVGDGKHGFPHDDALSNILKYTDMIYMPMYLDIEMDYNVLFHGDVKFKLNRDGTCDVSHSNNPQSTNINSEENNGVMGTVWFQNSRLQFLDTYILNSGDTYTSNSTLIKYGHIDILIDCGSESTNSLSYIEKIRHYVVDGKIDYLIVSNLFEKNISQLIGTYKGNVSQKNGILDLFEIGTIIDCSKTNSTKISTSWAARYIGKRDDKISGGTKYIDVAKNNSFTINLSTDLTLSILDNYFYKNNATYEGDYSVCTKITYKNEQLLFVGDLTNSQNASDHLIDKNNISEVTFYQASSNGSDICLSNALLAEITPMYVGVNVKSNKNGDISISNNLKSLFLRYIVTTDSSNLKHTETGSGEYRDLNFKILYEREKEGSEYVVEDYIYSFEKNTSFSSFC